MDLLQKESGCEINPVQKSIDIFKIFRKKEYSGSIKFRGNLEISKNLRLAIQINTKTRECELPELKKYNKELPENDNENVNRVLS